MFLLASDIKRELSTTFCGHAGLRVPDELVQDRGLDAAAFGESSISISTLDVGAELSLVLGLDRLLNPLLLTH